MKPRQLVLAALLLIPSLALGNSLERLLDDRSAAPLPAREAFPVRAEFVAPDAVEIHWNTQPGYYLYRKELSFELPSGSADVAGIDLPDGQIKDDPYFGPQEVYYGALSARITLDRAVAAPLALRVYYQGCADAGLCYPIESAELSLTPPAGTKPGTLWPWIGLAVSVAATIALAALLLSGRKNAANLA